MWTMYRISEKFEAAGRRTRTDGVRERVVMRGTAIVHRLAVGIVCLLMAAPPLVLALELGPIDARSALYEPLDARIPIRGARSGDFERLNIMLGSPAQFELAGVARLQHLNLLEFVVVERGEGSGYIHVRTDEPIIEPTLTFLIDVDWPRGRTVRGYRLHLAAAASVPADSRPSRPATPGAQPESETDVSGTRPVSPGIDYGPVRTSETLWSIAARLRPDDSVSVQRMMLAIVEANPKAFVIGNVNGLHAGVTLRIPGRDEIGPDNLRAAVAEVARQHSAWSEHHKRMPAAPMTPSTATEPSGRVEVVSPETATGVTGQEDRAAIDALRKEIALATEEADAASRENDELKLRLSEAEDHIKELNRLVELKNEEIAALQADLRAMSEAKPEPEPVLTPAEGESKPAAMTDEAQPAPSEEESRPAAMTDEAQPALAEEESKPSAMTDEAQPVPVPAETEPKPAMAAEEEPKPLPFGLGTLPVNPVFLVGGAGLLLLLLGVLALLRRRRTSAAEEDVLEFDETSSPDEANLLGEDNLLDQDNLSVEDNLSDEDNLLVELEAVAAELAEERGDPPNRVTRAGLGAVRGGSEESGPPASDAARSGPESLVERQVAELWRDEDDAATERGHLAETDADDDASEITFDIDALIGDESELSRGDGEMSADFDIGDLSDLADLADLDVDRETDPGLADPGRTADDEVDGHDRIFGQREAGATDSGTPRSAARTDARELSEPHSGILDGGQDHAQLETLDDQGSVDAESGTAGTPDEDPDWSTDMSAERSVDFEPGPVDESDGSGPAPPALFDEPTEGGESDAYSLEDLGEDEVQTKIDLAQVYMEMGDTESARGFLEAVLAEGDAEQQNTAREMLAKLA